MNADTDADADPDADPDADAAGDVDADADAAVDVDLDFGENGLVPVVAQDADSGDVLMLAYATRDAVKQSAATGRAHYYSRSRDELWEKGATSGHTQEIQEIRVDCDGDALLYVVEQESGACHTGHRSCFYRTLDGEQVGETVFEPDDVY